MDLWVSMTRTLRREPWRFLASHRSGAGLGSWLLGAKKGATVAFDQQKKQSEGVLMNRGRNNGCAVPRWVLSRWG
jgi:hypothetical protein